MANGCVSKHVCDAQNCCGFYRQDIGDIFQTRALS